MAQNVKGAQTADYVFDIAKLREDEQSIPGFIAEQVRRHPSTPRSARTSPSTTRYLPALLGDEVVRLQVLPGKAVSVYLLVLLQCRYHGMATVTLRSTFLQRYGLTRYAKTRALHQLQQAGFLRVEQVSGENPTVTLIEPLRRDWIAHLEHRRPRSQPPERKDTA